MASFNKVILMGNLTRDPQVRYIPSGKAVAEIGLAVNRTWFDKQANTKREEVTFVDVTLWGRQAEVAGEYLSKGRSVLIEGHLTLDQWDDRETGKKRSKLKVVCENMTMVGGRSSGGQGGGGQSGSPAADYNAGAPSEEYGNSFDQNAPNQNHPNQNHSDQNVPGGPPEDEVPF